MNRTLTLLSGLALTLALAPLASAVSYVDDAQPVFSAKCATCHTTGGSGGHNIGISYADSQRDASACSGLTMAACAIERIEDGSMPQGAGCIGPVADGADNADVCVTETEFDLLEAWITAGAPEADTDPAPRTNMPVSDGDPVGGGGDDGGGGCQAGGGPLGGLMLLLSGLALFATRRARDWRRPFPSLR